MIQSIGLSVLVLGLIGVLSSVILYFVAQKFKVIENPLIDEVADLLPGANCGGCGFSGCRAFAERVVSQGNLEELLCPVGGSAVQSKIAALLGISVEMTEPKLAVLKCNGISSYAPSKSQYDGLSDCVFAHSFFIGKSGCANACLGLGNCVRACLFDAIELDPKRGVELPKIDEDLCVACGACVKACPRNLLELRKKGKNSRRVWVSCANTDKGALAKKNCSVACIGCGKCQKECAFDAIKIENNLAYIDSEKCRLCRKCVGVCPTGAIHEHGFPARKGEVAEREGIEQ